MDNLTLTLTPQEAQTVWNALMEIPGKHVYGLARKIEGQLTQQGALSSPAASPEKSPSQPDPAPPVQ